MKRKRYPISYWLYDILPVYLKIPFSNGKQLAIWNCAGRGKIGKPLTLKQNLIEIRITIRDEHGGLFKEIKKGIY